MENYEVFHSIYGLTVDAVQPVAVGDFQFFDLIRHENYVASKYHLNVESKLFRFENGCDSCVSIQIPASTIDEAKDQATECFTHLQNYFRFAMNSLLDHDFDVGIYNYKRPNRNYYLILSNNADGQEGFNALGGFRKIDISAFTNNIYFSYIASIITKDTPNELEKRKLIALDFLGESQHTFGSAVSLFQLVAAIDALIGDNVRSQKCLFKKHVAQLLGNSSDEQQAIEKEAERLYNIRSKIAHGEKNQVQLQDCKSACTIAYKAYTEMISNQAILKINTYSELKQYLKERELYRDANVQD